MLLQQLICTKPDLNLPQQNVDRTSEVGVNNHGWSGGFSYWRYSMHIIWSKRYSVGVDEIDAQHKGVVEMINLL